MIGNKIEKLADMILENEKEHLADKDIIVYGLLNAIEQGASIITTVILGCLFGLLIESLLFLISFSMIRMYAGGYHCNKEIHCYFMSSGIIIAVLAIVKLTPIDYVIPIGVVILFVSVPIILKIAPIGTTNKPLDEVEKKHYRKKTILNLEIECFIILVLLIIELNVFAFVIILGIMVAMGVVLLQNQLSWS